MLAWLIHSSSSSFAPQSLHSSTSKSCAYLHSGLNLHDSHGLLSLSTFTSKILIYDTILNRSSGTSMYSPVSSNTPIVPSWLPMTVPRMLRRHAPFIHSCTRTTWCSSNSFIRASLPPSAFSPQATHTAQCPLSLPATNYRYCSPYHHLPTVPSFGTPGSPSPSRLTHPDAAPCAAPGII